MRDATVPDTDVQLGVVSGSLRPIPLSHVLQTFIDDQGNVVLASPYSISIITHGAFNVLSLSDIVISSGLKNGSGHGMLHLNPNIVNNTVVQEENKEQYVELH